MVCAPGCRIIRKKDFVSKPGGVMQVGTGASWTGATFVGEPEVVTVDGVEYEIYPDGQIIRVLGDDAVLRNVGIRGYRGIGMMVAADRVRIYDPKITKPQEYVPPYSDSTGMHPEVPGDGAGIRVKRGTGFRCYGGSVTSGGDAAIQFSGDKEFEGLGPPTDITNGLFQDVAVGSVSGGRLMLIGTTFPNIHHVGFLGITGKAIGKGDCIRVQNRNPDTGPIPKKTISHAFFRDISVADGDPSSYAVAVLNELTVSAGEGDDIAVSELFFGQLTVTTNAPADIPFATYAFADPALRPLRDFTWRAGMVLARHGSINPSIQLSQLDGGLFDGLRIDAGNNPFGVVLGSSIDLTPTLCRNVALRDLSLWLVGDPAFFGEQHGVTFGTAVNCGMVRGAVAQTAGTMAVGVKFIDDPRRCFVARTNLAGVTGPRVIAAGEAPRARDLYGDPLTLVPPVGPGAPETVAMSMHMITGRAGQLLVNPGGGGTLNIIDGGAPGAVLVLRTAGGSMIVHDNSTLSLGVDRTLATTANVLTLVNTAPGAWSGLAYT